MSVCYRISSGLSLALSLRTKFENEEKREEGNWLVFAAVIRTSASQPSIGNLQEKRVHRNGEEIAQRQDTQKYGRKECSGWKWDGGARQGLALKSHNPHSEMRKPEFGNGLLVAQTPNRWINFPSLRYLVESARISWLTQILECAPFWGAN